MAASSFNAVPITQGDRTFFLTKMRAKDLVQISYASVRGRDDEEGAVQRILNPRRIDSIKDFTLAGGDYPNCIILNWVGGAAKLRHKGGKLHIPLVDRAAQIIDGQHRVEGIRQAIKAKHAIGSLEVPVAIYDGLTTKACADIFLSINTEQKPVARSLVFDLYDVASDYVVDSAAVRARDLAASLNEDPASPYFGLIRFPSGEKNKGPGIDLSTVVTSLKPLVEEKGMFEQAGVDELTRQTAAIINFFTVLKEWYGGLWNDKDNVFLSAAGFSGAIDFFKNKLIFYCNLHQSFEINTIRNAMDLDSQAVILRSHFKGTQGREALRGVSDLLAERFQPQGTSTKSKKKIKF
jgi:DNA sulfur modification protein DndB